MAGQNALIHIPLSKIRENPVALRSVNRTTEAYQGLVDSIKRDGVLTAILVREVEDPDTKETVYGLIDGLHRFSASQDAGKDTIPAQVTSMEDADVLEAQVLANVHKVETRPVEYSKQLVRILAQSPLMPLSELATRLSKSPGWLNERLGLVKLEPAIASLVDEGKVNLSNAYALAKLPVEEQPNFLERAMTMTPQEFVPTANGRIKELKDAKRQGRAAAAGEFVPIPHLRKVSELKDEMDSKLVASVLTKELNISNPIDAFNLGVKWALHMDPTSVQVAKDKDAQRQKEAAEAKAKRDKDKLEKAQREASEKAETLKAQLEAAK